MKDFEALEPDKILLLNKHFSSGRGNHAVEFAGIHHMASNGTVETCYNTWQNREASAHYCVSSDGSDGQCVYDRDTAWALGDFDANQRSINIEHANLADGTVTEACIDDGAHIVAAICKKYGLGRPQWGVNMFPHSHFSATACPGSLYGSQKDQYEARAQYWYDMMTGAVQPEKPVSEHLPEALRGFTDLDPDAWYIAPIEECVREGYINGYKGGKAFGPSDTLTRGQAVCVMANFKRVDLTDYLEQFEDVSAEPYYYTALCWALDNGYVSTASGKFRPGDAVTRSDFLTFLWRMEGEPEVTTDADLTDTPEWAKKAVAWAYEQGVIEQMRPNDPCSRAEAAAILYNLSRTD